MTLGRYGGDRVGVLGAVIRIRPLKALEFIYTHQLRYGKVRKWWCGSGAVWGVISDDSA
jgi:hypothetical protein